MATATVQAEFSYGAYGPITILETLGNLSKILTSSEDEFWVRTEKIKTKKFNRRFTPTEPPPLDESADAWQTFVNYLEHTGYRLEVHTKASGLEKVHDEYIEWAGESLPDSVISIYENRPVERCWRLFFFLREGTATPFPVDLYGVTGKHPTNNPRALWQPNGCVDLYFACIIEKLIRAGLRVSIDGTR